MNAMLPLLLALCATASVVVREEECPSVLPNFAVDLCGAAVAAPVATGLASAHAAPSAFASPATLAAAASERAPAPARAALARERLAALLAKPRKLSGVKRQYLAWSGDSAARAARAALAARGWRAPTNRTVVWELLSYVGVGNALDAYARAAMEALYRGHELAVRCPIVGKLCAILDCGLAPPPKNASIAWVGPKRYAEATGEPVARFVDDFMFKWRFNRVPDEYRHFLDLLAQVLGCDAYPRKLRLACARASLLRDAVRGPRGPLLGASREFLRDHFVGGGFDAALDAPRPPLAPGGAPAPPYALALHLRTLDFIEGANRSARGDGAAVAWLSSPAAAVAWTCLERRLRALKFGACGPRALYVAADSPAAKRAFAAAIAAAFPAAAVDYFDGLSPPHYSKWFAPVTRAGALKPRDWWSLVGAAADWYFLASAGAVVGLKGTRGASFNELPSSFARTASLYAGVVDFDVLSNAAVAGGRVACCAWESYRRW